MFSLISIFRFIFKENKCSNNRKQSSFLLSPFYDRSRHWKYSASIQRLSRYNPTNAFNAIRITVILRLFFSDFSFLFFIFFSFFLFSLSFSTTIVFILLLLLLFQYIYIFFFARIIFFRHIYNFIYKMNFILYWRALAWKWGETTLFSFHILLSFILQYIVNFIIFI